MSERNPRPEDPTDHPKFWEPSLAFLKYGAAFTMAGSAAFLIAIVMLTPDQPLRAFGPASMSVVAATAWFLLSRGRIDAAVHVLAIGIWSAVTGIAFFTGGLSATIVIVYPQIILLIGWMISIRAAVAVALLTVAMAFAFALAESRGLLPPPPPTPPELRWIVQSFVFVFSVALVAFFVRSYQRRLREKGKLGSDLALRTAELQAREADLNRAQEVAHIGSWVYDIGADVVRLSAENCRILGVPEGTRGSRKSYLSRVHPEDRSALESAWLAALKGDDSFDNEHRILVGGSIRWVAQKVKLESGIDGTRQRAVGTMQDITERKQAEATLRESEIRFRTLVEWSPEPILVYRDGIVIFVNPAAVKLIGATSAHELAGRPVLDFVHPDFQQVVLARIKSAAERGAGAPLAEVKAVKLDGTTIDVEIQSASTLFDGMPAVHVAMRDITERKHAEARQDQLEAQLRESQKMEALGTLAGGVAHDFNNIVATIMGNAELAGQDVGPGHAAQESLEEIRKSSRRAKELVQQILAFGRRQVLERQVISLAPVVEESARLLRATLPAGVGLSVACAPDAPAALADATQVQQVLLNLCSNAWHALQAQPRPGAIEISLAAHTANGAAYAGPERRSWGGRVPLRPGRYACVTVRDNGVGMDEATVERIFEPFFTTKPLGKGTGLGLAVVHGIVQSHGASIDVHSTPGEGTAFRIYFPAQEAPVSAVAAPARDGVPAQGHGQHILYVDDEEAIVFLMTRLLERRGYRVSGYTDARKALAAVRAQPYAFDLAVTDYNMPGMSGLELARALRETRADLPVALASGYVTEELRAEAPAAGVMQLVYKPNTADELCEVIAHLASAPRIKGDSA